MIDRTKTFISFPEFMSVYDSEDFEVDKSLAEHWEKELPNFLNNPESLIHFGDCTKHPITCTLCLLESSLREYRVYCESGKSIKDFFETL